jgi:ribosome-associated heat shock protein Hsp15
MTASGESVPVTDHQHADKLRVDKWLWAARFYKTRSVAAEAVDSGKVLVNGARVKPARAVKVGDELRIATPGADYTVHVAELSPRRGSASEAVKLYAEGEESKRRREEARLLRSDRHPDAYVKGRPTKRARRQIQKIRTGPR